MAHRSMQEYCGLAPLESIPGDISSARESVETRIAEGRFPAVVDVAISGGQITLAGAILLPGSISRIRIKPALGGNDG